MQTVSAEQLEQQLQSLVFTALYARGIFRYHDSSTKSLDTLIVKAIEKYFAPIDQYPLEQFTKAKFGQILTALVREVLKIDFSLEVRLKIRQYLCEYVFDYHQEINQIIPLED